VKAYRTPSAQDLNIPDPPEDADPQIAAGFNPDSAATSFAQMAHPAAADPAAGISAAGVVSSASSGGQWTGAIAPSGTPAGPEQSLVVPRTDDGNLPGRSLSRSGAGLELDTILADLLGDVDHSRDRVEGGTDEARPLPGAGVATDGPGAGRNPVGCHPDGPDGLHTRDPAP
jgi:hypothetical protein